MNEQDKKLGREFLKSEHAKDIPQDRKELYAKAWSPERKERFARFKKWWDNSPIKKLIEDK